MLQRVSMIIQVTTNPIDRGSASAHSGGWTESFWLPLVFPFLPDAVNVIAQRRAALLPVEASIVGYRAANYTLASNRLIPEGTSTGKFLMPGGSGLTCDLPQVALELNAKTADGPNTSTMSLRGIPDAIMVGGEYQPSPAFKAALTRYITAICFGNVWGFVGRDKTQPSSRLLAIGAGSVKLLGGIGGVPGTDYIRFNRVFDSTGKPVQKICLITGFTAPGTYAVSGLDGVTAGEGGSARVDKLKFFDISSIDPSRSRVKKIGRPFESYHGRASKRRA